MSTRAASFLSADVMFQNNLSPDAFLARTDGRGYTSAETEIWDTAHRLYVYLATCQRAPKPERLRFFRLLVRLCIRHRSMLLKGVSSQAEDKGMASIEACAVCYRRKYSEEKELQSERTTGHCCWFRPDSRARGFLDLVRSLCDDHPELFGDDVSLEELDGLFVFE
ncbi:hypothetical protein HMPREF1624_02682 [Sporothrix schenckii ATCC 58251]|uniref:Uncharacterized protein n=1 Tax=Sporothrix schenckii (strain ATCC 58251 / de Perez 2211183) TaxID=1391915 RepID=U7Q377_SPOS1|nr:hypothetical protein HMPREF1624_02682 [Sporothrix schenckii ATCC 58251]